MSKANELFSLKGRTALVTGASSGMGRHFVKTLADAGARVVCAARRKDEIEVVAAEIRAAGGDAIAVAVDTRNGRRYNNLYHFLFKLRDGKVAAVKEYLDTMHTNAILCTP